LPAEVARPAHVRIEGQTWTLLAETTVGGMVRAAGDSASIGHGMIVELGKYRVRVSPAPADARATPPQRTESLARELVRSLLGEGAAPWLEIERGTNAGTRRLLPPPEAKLVIGRGDEATWVILDEDLSRAHAEIRRGWDGVTVVDLDSKNGTRVDGAKLGSEPVELHDGATLALGDIVMRFRDPAERHLRGEPVAAKPSSRSAKPATPSAGRPSSPWPFVAFTAIAVLALAALIWILAT
jgi:predicted component of type VI protein secretion system